MIKMVKSWILNLFGNIGQEICGLCIISWLNIKFCMIIINRSGLKDFVPVGTRGPQAAKIFPVPNWLHPCLLTEAYPSQTFYLSELFLVCRHIINGTCRSIVRWSKKQSLVMSCWFAFHQLKLAQWEVSTVDASPLDLQLAVGPRVLWKQGLTYEKITHSWLTYLYDISTNHQWWWYDYEGWGLQFSQKPSIW